jgi:uncharacterized protein (DUF2147 family)
MCENAAYLISSQLHHEQTTFHQFDSSVQFTSGFVQFLKLFPHRLLFCFHICDQISIYQIMRLALVFILCLGLLSNSRAQAPSDKIVGIWINEEKTNKIEIYKVGNAYHGKIVWTSAINGKTNSEAKDINNPKPELRNRNIIGMEIITGLKYANGKWNDGSIYSPKKGIYAHCYAELMNNGQQLKIIVSKSGYTKTQTWIRQ